SCLPCSRPARTSTVSFRPTSTRLSAVSIAIAIKFKTFRKPVSRFPRFQSFENRDSRNLATLKLCNLLLQNFWSQTYNLQKLLLAQLSCHRTEYARSHRLAGFVDQNRSVLVETD